MTTATKQGKCYWCGIGVNKGDNCCRECAKKPWQPPEHGPVSASKVREAILITPILYEKPSKLAPPEDWITYRNGLRAKDEPRHECQVCGERHLTATQPFHSSVAPATHRDASKPKHPSRDASPATCPVDGQPIADPRAKYCSPACRKQAWRAHVRG